MSKRVSNHQKVDRLQIIYRQQLQKPNKVNIDLLSLELMYPTKNTTQIHHDDEP